MPSVVTGSLATTTNVAIPALRTLALALGVKDKNSHAATISAAVPWSSTCLHRRMEAMESQL